MKHCLITVAAALALIASPTYAFDSAQYRSIVGETVTAINAGNVDVKHLVALQEQLLDLGVTGAREYAAADPEQALLMEFVADNADAMTKMSLDEIEAAWHEGEALASIGIDLNSLDHFGPAVSHMDAVVHPATAVIALHDYEATGDEDLLEQVVDELSEVVEHISHLE